MNIRLGELLIGQSPELSLTDAERDQVVRGLSLDSRKVKKGDLFFAYPGAVNDGREYLREALDRGAIAVVIELGNSENDEEFSFSDFHIPVVRVEDVRRSAGEMAATFWQQPSQSLTVVAVTGTNGKTSVTQMIAQSIELLGEKSAVIGTLGNGAVDQLEATKNTTPDALQVQRLLAGFAKEAVVLVAIEASSHGLSQQRLAGTKIDVGVVTNISRDHLDYHGTMEAYQMAKADLVKWPGIRVVVLNADDHDAMLLSAYVSSDVELITYSHKGNSANVYAEDVVFNKQGIEFTLVTPTGRAKVENQLVGEFNVSNLLAVASVLHCKNYKVDKIALALTGVRQVPGRMQDVVLKDTDEVLPGVVVDFAHTPDALEKALVALKPHCKGKLWCVFGCGGERDKGKRPEMGAIAVKYADRVLLTADNPRSESASEIVQEIENGIEFGAAYQVELDRNEAVRCAIMNAANEDVVLLAGKGHETYQEINGTKHHYSDREAAEKALHERVKGLTAGGDEC